jgi:hypothetical protein
LSVWWLLQQSWRFDVSVHSSWDRLRWTRAADRRRTASVSTCDERQQLDWLAEAACEEHIDLDALTPQEVDERALAAFPYASPEANGEGQRRS